MSTEEVPASEPMSMEEEQTAGKRSAWMAHVKKTMRANKGKSLKDVLKMAGKTYKKSGKKTARNGRKGKKFLGMFGGMVAETAADVAPQTAGRRRRSSKKTLSRRR